MDKKYSLYKMVKKKGTWDMQFGFVVNGENRKTLIGTTSSWLKYVHSVNNNPELQPFRIPEDILEEMNYFVIKKSKIECVEHDDLIFALIAALYVRDNKASFFNWKGSQARVPLGEKFNQFFSVVDSNSYYKALKNGKINAVIARNFMSKIRKQNMTVDELNMMDAVLKWGKEQVGVARKEKDESEREKVQEVKKSREEQLG
jgi:hypothetical protein